MWLPGWPDGVTEMRGDGWSVEIADGWIYLNDRTISLRPSEAVAIANLMLLAAAQAEAAQ